MRMGWLLKRAAEDYDPSLGELIEAKPTPLMRALGGAGGAVAGYETGNILGRLAGSFLEDEKNKERARHLGQVIGAAGGAGLGAGVSPFFGTMFGAGSLAGQAGSVIGEKARAMLAQRGVDVDPDAAHFAGRMAAGIPAIAGAHELYEYMMPRPRGRSG
jgi:hypothetical protein